MFIITNDYSNNQIIYDLNYIYSINIQCVIFKIL